MKIGSMNFYNSNNNFVSFKLGEVNNRLTRLQTNDKLHGVVSFTI